VSNPAFSDLIEKLEAERNNLDYKKTVKPAPEVVRVIVKEKVYPTKKAQETRDKLMFNAGRYAAGHRDSAAETANLWLEKQLDA
jgi:hypothetical protein